MAPQNLRSGGDDSSWKSVGKVGQLLVNNVDLKTTFNDSFINALQGLKIESELVINPLDFSVNNSLIDLSEGMKEDEWLLSASLAGSCEDGDTLRSQDWLTRHPSQDVCDSEKKKLLVDMLDGITDQNPGDSDSVFSSPTCQDNQPQPSSIRRIMNSHENSPYLLPLPSRCINGKSQLWDETAKLDAASSYLESHLHSPTLSDNPLSPTGILSLSPLHGFKVSSAANLTFDSLHSPPTKTGHSPPWPQLVSTPSAKPNHLTKSWHQAGSKLGQLVPPQFEPKMELSPPTGERCLNTTETKVTICVQDTDEQRIAVGDAIAQQNTTQNKETPINTTQNMETPMNMTQAMETPVNTTQTIETPMNTTQTMEHPLNTTQIKETPMNTTQTVAPHDLPNTTQTFAEEPCNTTQTLGGNGMNTTQPCESHINTTQTLYTFPLNTTAEVPHNTTQTHTTLGNISPGLPVNNLSNSMALEEKKSLNTTQNLDDCLQYVSKTKVTPLNTIIFRDTSPKNNSSNSLLQIGPECSDKLSCVALNPTSSSDTKTSSESQLCPSLSTEQSDELNYTSVIKCEDLDFILESSTISVSSTYQTIIPVSSIDLMHNTHPQHQNQESSLSSPIKDEFMRNSKMTGTYRVSPLLDSKGKKLPGPGVKQSKQISEGARPIVECKAGVKVRSHNLPRSSMRGYNCSEKFKQIPEVQILGKSTQELKTVEVAVKLLAVKLPALKPIKKPEKSENLGKTNVSTMEFVKPRLSVKLKPSKIVPAKKNSLTHKLSTTDKSISSQPKPPLPVPPKLPVASQSGSIQSSLRPVHEILNSGIRPSLSISGIRPSLTSSGIRPPLSCSSGIRPPLACSSGIRPPLACSSGIRPPLAISGIRPPSARRAISGIARLANRQSLVGSKLPMPGRVG